MCCGGAFFLTKAEFYFGITLCVMRMDGVLNRVGGDVGGMIFR